MTKLLPEYKRSTVYALIGMAFHFVVVVVPLLLSGGTGKFAYAHGHLLLFLDFPLTLLEVNIRTIEHFVVTSTRGYILYYSFGGTLLYALGGWVIGYWTEAFLRWRLRKSAEVI